VAGNLKAVAQVEPSRSFNYDSLGRLTSAANPESGTISYQYDSNGNLTRRQDARGVVTVYTYDALNRPLTRDYSDTTPDVTFVYEASARNRFVKDGRGIGKRGRDQHDCAPSLEQGRPAEECPPQKHGQSAQESAAARIGHGVRSDDRRPKRISHCRATAATPGHRRS